MDRPTLTAPRSHTQTLEPSTDVVRRRAVPAVAANGENACLFQVHPTDKDMGSRHVVSGQPFLIGRDPSCQVCLDDDYVSRFHAQLALKEGNYYVADCRSTNGTFVNDEPTFLRQLHYGDSIQIGRHIFRFLSGNNVETLYHEEIARLVITDALTGIGNLRCFRDFLGRELCRAERYARPLSLALLDIDRFKEISDRLGRLAGDYVLRELACRLRGTVRREDLLARHGEEEFAAVFRECSAGQAAVAAERMRRIVAAEPFRHHDERIHVTISVGIAALQPGMSADELIQLADANLYRARAGQNRVVV
jgi:diguanylate cyclase (GGDEF)-like protein